MRYLIHKLLTLCLGLGGVFPYLAMGESSGSSNQYRNDAVYELVTLNWPPYIFSENGKVSGYDVDVVKAAFDAVKIEPAIDVDISVLPWKRALLSSELGRYVALFPKYYDKSKKGEFTYSDVYSGSKLYFFKLKSNDFVLPKNWVFKKSSDFRILKNRSVGIVRGYINTSEFDNSRDFKKIEVGTDIDLLELLYKKRVDLIVMDYNVMQHFKEKFSPKYNEIEPLPSLLSRKKHYLAFSNANYLTKQAVSDFNKGLKIIRNNGTLNKLMKKYKLN